MKTIYKLYLPGFLAALLICVSCNDDFMDRYPETEISDKVFFKTVKDLETYTNGLYDADEVMGPSYYDLGTDDANTTDNYPNIYRVMLGEISPKNAGKWKWETLRKINFLIENSVQTQGERADIDHYVGIARLFRAYHYYGKVKKYSDVPWYSRTLQTTDEELLYKTQDSRKLVVDSIMKDLEFAAQHVKDYDSKTRITKWSALALQARIALNEGTFRKYHPELELNDADDFLKIARDAAKEIFINNNKFSLNVEKGELHPYEALFRSNDLSRNPEIIMYKDYDKSLGKFNNSQAALNFVHSLSRDLMEDYLAFKDGKAVPFHQIPGYDKKTFTEVFTDRDPRINYTFMQPGYTRDGYTQAVLPKMGLGGYPQVKFDPRSYDQFGWDNTYTDLPIIRLAEVYLIYAEARAELGELTQNDLDITVNLIRDRVGMPPMILSEVLGTIDPVQEERYNNVTGSQRGAILEIRRERRIELACEGFRLDDIFRWGIGPRLMKDFEGIYIEKLGYQDLTGDGIPDIAIVARQEDADKIPADEKEKYKLVIYILAGDTFFLTGGDHGYIKLTSLNGKFKFESPKHYYFPLDEQDILLNENLVQNKYWK